MSSSKQELLNLLYDDPIQLGIWCGFNKLTELHNGWLKEMLYGTEDFTLLAHRESYKSTTLSVYLALQIVLFPDRKCKLFRKSQTDVEAIIRQVHNLLDSGYFRYIVQVLYNRDLQFKKYTSAEITTNLDDTVMGDPQLRGLSISSSITGLHGWVVTDDIVTFKDRYSRAEREATRAKYTDIAGNIASRGTKIINLGTPWHPEDAITKMPNQHTYDCYSTGLMNKEDIQKVRSMMTASEFAANYELRHIASDAVLFKEAQFYSGDPSDINNGQSHIDAAYGGEDYTAYTIMKKVDDDHIIALGKLWHKHVDDCLIDIENLQTEFMVGTVHCEDNADKGYLKKDLKQRGWSVSGYHESMNKYLKISTYLYKHWKEIYWLEETDPEYIRMVCDYSEDAAHDDAPDSAASLVRIICKVKSKKGIGRSGGL